MTGANADTCSMPDGRRRAAWLAFGLAALVSMTFLWNVSEPRVLFGDFLKAYYPAGSLVRTDPAALYGFPPTFNCIPIVAWLFVPLSWLGKSAAGVLVTLVGAMAVGLTCYGLIRLTGVSGWKRMALIGLFVINGPLYNSLREGNLTHFVFPVLLAALYCLEQRRDAWL
ncbi:MAG: glycosyltransferase 87 family protein, partial [Planctomycetota bacterium]